MERFLQYLDDIDDLAGALGLQRERFLRLLLRLLRAALGLMVVGCAFWFAMTYPTAALATSALLAGVLGLRLRAAERHPSLESH